MYERLETMSSVSDSFSTGDTIGHSKYRTIFSVMAPIQTVGGITSTRFEFPKFLPERPKKQLRKHVYSKKLMSKTKDGMAIDILGQKIRSIPRTDVDCLQKSIRELQTHYFLSCAEIMEVVETPKWRFPEQVRKTLLNNQETIKKSRL